MEATKRLGILTGGGDCPGLNAAIRAKSIKDAGELTLNHMVKYNQEVEKINIPREKISPMVLPDYIPDSVKAKWLQSQYNGTLL